MNTGCEHAGVILNEKFENPKILSKISLFQFLILEISKCHHSLSTDDALSDTMI